MTEKEPQVLQDDDYSNLIKLLQKNRDDFLDYEYDARDSNLRYLFYSSARMKEIYLRSSDIVFINKRLTQNRFNRPIILWFNVSNTGQSQLIALAMVEREETAAFARVSKAFLKHMGNVSPQTIIIERQLKLFQALQDTMHSSTVLFCYYHIWRTLKT